MPHEPYGHVHECIPVRYGHVQGHMYTGVHVCACICALQVDMLVGDIYGGRDYNAIGLSATTIASSFGKVVSQVW